MHPICAATRILVATLALVTIATESVWAAEVIQSFDAEVRVMPDGVLEVTETIRVRAEGEQIKRGIFRDFPLTYVDADGRSRRVTFELQEVTRDGRPEPHHTRANDRGIRIYAGDADVFLSSGIYTYQFSYRTSRQIRFFPEHTELFWNVTGNEWAFPIEAVSARFILAEGTRPLDWTAYTGPFGARGGDYSVDLQPDQTLLVTTIRPLRPGEGLSVAIEIPEGLVARPTGTQALGIWLAENRGFILGGLGLIAVFVFYLTTWNAIGRDPPMGTVIPLFHPPSGISPAMAGYIREFGWSGGWREFTAAAMSLAVKGLAIFDEDSDTLTLRLTETGQTIDRGILPPGERALRDWLAGQNGAATINQANGESLASAFSLFKSSVERETRGRFFRKNSGYFSAGMVLTGLTFAAVLIFGGLSEAETALLFVFVVVGAFIGVTLVTLIRKLFSGRPVLSVVGIIAKSIALVVLIINGAVIAAGNMLNSLPDDFSGPTITVLLANSFPLALVSSLAVMNAVFYYLLRAPTVAGRAVMDQLQGLELYIRTAETERLNMAGAPDLNAAQFERILPYAIALDAERPWSDAFASAFARAHNNESMSTGYQPGWSSRRNWNRDTFGQTVSSTIRGAEKSFASSLPAPKSSSSGFSVGGGFSGGGGGGGGGGGW